MTDGALAGVRVLGLTRVLAGRFSAMLFGDLGADVLEVERPGRGDDTRAWGPRFAEGESAHYLNINRNKRTMTLDLGTARGRGILGELIEACDVVMDNFELGTLGRRGIDDDSYAVHAPAAILCSIGGTAAVVPVPADSATTSPHSWRVG